VSSAVQCGTVQYSYCIVRINFDEIIGVNQIEVRLLHVEGSQHKAPVEGLCGYTVKQIIKIINRNQKDEKDNIYHCICGPIKLPP
jgi:hypothetical protein